MKLEFVQKPYAVGFGDLKCRCDMGKRVQTRRPSHEPVPCWCVVWPGQVHFPGWDKQLLEQSGYGEAQGRGSNVVAQWGFFWLVNSFFGDTASGLQVLKGWGFLSRSPGVVTHAMTSWSGVLIWVLVPWCVQIPESSALPGRALEMQNFRNCSRPTASNCIFQQDPRVICTFLNIWEMSLV